MTCWQRIREHAAIAVAAVLMCAGAAGAQTTSDAAWAVKNGVVLGQAAAASAVVTGIVEDEDEDAVEGASVAVVSTGGTKLQTVTDATGRFAATLPAGTQTVTVTVRAPGFVVNSATAGVVGTERREMAAIGLRAGAAQTVEAISSVEQAEIEMKQEEQQRLFGAIPNFYVSYAWNAQPLTAKQKYRLAWKTVIDPVNWALNAGSAGIEQADNALPGYGRGWSGYGKRFAATSGDFVVGTYFGGAVFPALFHQDPRYFYKGTGSVKSRFFYALSTAVMTRGDNGKWQPGYANVLGDLSAGVAANAWAAKSDRDGWSLVMENGLLAAGLDGVGNVIQEFLFKKVTPKKKQ